MLVFTRRRNEGFHIGPDIHVLLLDLLSSGKAKLGVIAPSDTVILRDELIRPSDKDSDPRPGGGCCCDLPTVAEEMLDSAISASDRWMRQTPASGKLHLQNKKRMEACLLLKSLLCDYTRAHPDGNEIKE